MAHRYTKHKNQSAVTRTQNALWYGKRQAASVLPVATVRTPDHDGAYLRPVPFPDTVIVYLWWTVGTCPPETNKHKRKHKSKGCPRWPNSIARVVAERQTDPNRYQRRVECGQASRLRQNRNKRTNVTHKQSNRKMQNNWQANRFYNRPSMDQG